MLYPVACKLPREVFCNCIKRHPQNVQAKLGLTCWTVDGGQGAVQIEADVTIDLNAKEKETLGSTTPALSNGYRYNISD